MKLTAPKRSRLVGFEDWGSFALLKLPPFRVYFHLHVRPDEKTERGLFRLTTSMTIAVKAFGKTIFERRGVFKSEQTWGLCVRLSAGERGVKVND